MFLLKDWFLILGNHCSSPLKKYLMLCSASFRINSQSDPHSKEIEYYASNKINFDTYVYFEDGHTEPELFIDKKTEKYNCHRCGLLKKSNI